MDKILKTLVKTGAILDGHFLLTSGLHSDKYVEKFRLIENPESLNSVCSSMAETYKDKNIDVVLGAAIGGILIAGGVGKHLNVKHIFTERVNGIMELRRGFTIKKKERVVIVEDVITTGGSVFELIRLVENHQGDIVRVINLVDRSEEGIDFGYPSTALLNLPSESWESETCPLCKVGKPISERGRTGKKVGIV